MKATKGKCYVSMVIPLNIVVEKGLSVFDKATAIFHCIVLPFLGFLSPVRAAQNVTLAWDLNPRSHRSRNQHYWLSIALWHR